MSGSIERRDGMLALAAIEAEKKRLEDIKKDIRAEFVPELIADNPDGANFKIRCNGAEVGTFVVEATKPVEVVYTVEAVIDDKETAANAVDVLPLECAAYVQAHLQDFAQWLIDYTGVVLDGTHPEKIEHTTGGAPRAYVRGATYKKFEDAGAAPLTISAYAHALLTEGVEDGRTDV